MCIVDQQMENANVKVYKIPQPIQNSTTIVTDIVNQ